MLERVAIAALCVAVAFLMFRAGVPDWVAVSWIAAAFVWLGLATFGQRG